MISIINKTDNYSLVKTLQIFSPISFCGGKTPRGFSPAGFFYILLKRLQMMRKTSIQLLYCFVKQYNWKQTFLFFKKTLRGFSPTIWNGRKTPRGKLKVGIKPYQSFSEIITIQQTYFLNLFWYLFFWKNPAGFFPHLKMWGKNPAQGFKNPAGFSKNPAFFFTLTFFFHYDRIFILGSKCICFTNLSLYLCIKVFLSLLHH